MPYGKKAKALAEPAATAPAAAAIIWAVSEGSAPVNTEKHAPITAQQKIAPAHATFSTFSVCSMFLRPTIPIFSRNGAVSNNSKIYLRPNAVPEPLRIFIV